MSKDEQLATDRISSYEASPEYGYLNRIRKVEDYDAETIALSLVDVIANLEAISLTESDALSPGAVKPIIDHLVLLAKATYRVAYGPEGGIEDD